MVVAVREDPQGDLFDDRERAALRLADVIAGDHKKATDDLFDDLRDHFTEPEIIALGWRISIFTGYGRFCAVLGLDSAGNTCAIAEAAGS